MSVISSSGLGLSLVALHDHLEDRFGKLEDVRRVGILAPEMGPRAEIRTRDEIDRRISVWSDREEACLTGP